MFNISVNYSGIYHKYFTYFFYIDDITDKNVNKPFTKCLFYNKINNLFNKLT